MQMNKKDCNTCEISANQLMDECPSCGAQFEHLSTDARVYGVIALFVVFGISLLLSGG
jgi:RNA polymerase subunit RPABC4/transcription elongation factor Spt4